VDKGGGLVAVWYKSAVCFAGFGEKLYFCGDNLDWYQSLIRIKHDFGINKKKQKFSAISSECDNLGKRFTRYGG